MAVLIGSILALIAADPGQTQPSSIEISEPPKEVSQEIQPVRITTDINKLNGQNWYEPENRNLGFRNMDKLVPFPHEISKGSGPIHEFGSDPHDLSKIIVEYFDEDITLEEYLQRSHTDAFLVLKGNDIVYEKYFRMDPNERHAIQSTSKTIVPALLGNYVLDGSVNLDKKMKDYFPDIGSGFAEATLQQVLEQPLVPQSLLSQLVVGSRTTGHLTMMESFILVTSLALKVSSVSI